MARVNFFTQSDTDFVRGFIYRYRDSEEPVDLTGNTLRMGIRKRVTDAIEFVLLTTENGGLVITDPPNGRFSILLSHQILLRLPTGIYVHSLLRITNGMFLRIWNGELTNISGPSRWDGVGINLYDFPLQPTPWQAPAIGSVQSTDALTGRYALRPGQQPVGP